MRREKREELYVTVPSLFRCPISMDVMKSPVSLCTGVTYDRTSIQTWLSQGHNTCPATMQVLPSTDVIPNLTLQRLIHLWLRHNPSTPSPSAVISPREAFDLIKSLANNADRLQSLQKIAEFVNFSDQNRRFVSRSNEAISDLVKILCDFDEIEVLESVVSVLHSISPGVETELNRLILRRSESEDCLSSLVSILRDGSLNSRIQAAKLLGAIAVDCQSQNQIASKSGLLNELSRMVNSETENVAIEAGLAALIAVATTRPVWKELIRFGIVRAVGKIVSRPETAKPVVEKALKVLGTVAIWTEGRARIGEDVECLDGIVKRLMKCSSAATEQGIAVLWSVCCMARDEEARERVGRSNGVTKVLLVMQSSCSLETKRMCGDLVKALRGKNSKSCLASYDTKTTHIMPY